MFADRGFTGHEYLKYFNLYNMNGRMYDPLVGRFLSADNVVQDPTCTQNYNRYSYCLNNPLKYTDPSGNRFAHSAIDNYNERMTNLTNGDYQYSNGFNSSDGGGDNGGSGGNGDGGYGLPGEGKNGHGLNGVYYDWKSNTYRSTETDNQVVGSGSWVRLSAYAGVVNNVGFQGYTWVFTPGSIGRWGNYDQSFWEKENGNDLLPILSAIGIGYDSMNTPIGITRAAIIRTGGDALKPLTHTFTIVGAIAGGVPAIYNIGNDLLIKGVWPKKNDVASFILAAAAVGLEFGTGGVAEAYDGYVLAGTIAVSAGSVSLDVYNALQTNKNQH